MNSCNSDACSAVLGLTGALGQECWPRCGSYPALKSILAMQTEPRASPNALQRCRRSGFNREGGTLEIIKVSYKQLESLQGRNKFRIRQHDRTERTTTDPVTPLSVRAILHAFLFSTSTLERFSFWFSYHQLKNNLLGGNNAFKKKSHETLFSLKTS